MAAARLEEILEYLELNGNRDCCERDIHVMLSDLDMSFEDFVLTLNNGIHKGFFEIIVKRQAGGSNPSQGIITFKGYCGFLYQ